MSEHKQCKCATWVRIPAETDGVLTAHHKDCPQHQGKQRYLRITLYGGVAYVQPVDEIGNAFNGEIDGAEVGTKWTVELIEMYPEQYEALGEFDGY